jgi:HEAT repeats
VDGDEHRSRSLLGQLELGLGAGFLRALDAPADQVGELVLDCVARDPRELGGDSRADYYALLLLAAGVSAPAVQRLVMAHEPASGDWDGGSELALDVLIRMAVRGDRRAQDAVIGYMASGVRWPHLLWELLEDEDGRSMNIPTWRSTVEELGAVLCHRFPSAEQFLSAMEEMGGLWGDNAGSPPWSLWAAKHPVIADALEHYDRAQADRPRRRPDLSSLSTQQLLVLGAEHHFVADLLEERASDADVQLFLAAARDGSPSMRGPAIRALAYQQRPEALELAAALSDDTDGRLRGHMRRALISLRYDQTRSLAREWLNSDQASRRWAAAEILECHAEAEDVPMVREYLCRDPLDRDTSNFLIIGSLVGALARNPDQGPYGELTSLFNNAPWSSYLRANIAAAMATTDPTFPYNTHATSCLWDSEPEVRALATKHVDTRDPAVLARLQVMAADWAEDAETQNAAQTRVSDR